jgi:hypothetical protein
MIKPRPAEDEYRPPENVEMEHASDKTEAGQMKD